MNEEIKHYGVVGMKWGVRRNPQKAMGKASTKLRKLDGRYQKKQEKANASAQKAENKTHSFFATESGIRKATQKANKHQNKANRAAYKTYKWYKAMEKTFSKTITSLSQEDINIGRRYVEKIERKSISRFENQYNNVMRDPGSYTMRSYDGMLDD